MHVAHDVLLGGACLAQKVHIVVDGGHQTALVLAVDAHEETVEEIAQGLLFAKGHFLCLGFLQLVLRLVVVCAVVMLVHVFLVGLRRVVLAAHIPVDGVDLLHGLLFVRTVGMVFEIVFKSCLRVVHQGVGPVLVLLCEQQQVCADGVAMLLWCILVVVEIGLQHGGVVALHGKLIFLLFAVVLGVVVHIEAHAEHEQGDDDRGKENRLVVLVAACSVVSVPVVVVGWGCRGCWCSRFGAWCAGLWCCRSLWLRLWCCRLCSAHGICRVAMWAYHFVFEINFAAVAATHDVACYLYAAAGACLSFVAGLVTTFWTFDHCHGLMEFYRGYYIIIMCLLSVIGWCRGQKCLNLISLMLCLPMNRLLST